jgi:hypothetical protein
MPPLGAALSTPPSQITRYSKNLEELNHLKFDQYYKKITKIYDIK